MDKIVNTFAALALGVGVTLGAGAAFAQPEETPCPPASMDPAAEQGSEVQREAQRTGRESGTETASAEMAAEGQGVGSVSQDVKRGGCPEIEELPMPEEE